MLQCSTIFSTTPNHAGYISENKEVQNNKDHNKEKKKCDILKGNMNNTLFESTNPTLVL